MLSILINLAISSRPVMQECYDYQEMGVGGTVPFTFEGEKKCWTGHPTSNSFILYPSSDDYIVQIALSPKGKDEWTVYKEVTAPRQIIVENKYDLIYAIRASKPMKISFFLIPQSRDEEKNGIVTHYKTSLSTNPVNDVTLTVSQEEKDGKVHRYTDEIVIINPNQQVIEITLTQKDNDAKLTQRNSLDPTTIIPQDRLESHWGNILALTLTSNSGKVDTKTVKFTTACQDTNPNCANTEKYPPIKDEVEGKTYFVSKDGQSVGSFEVGGDDDDDGGLSEGEIAAIVICVLIVVIAIIVACVYFLVIKPKKNGGSDNKKKSSSSSSSSSSKKK